MNQEQFLNLVATALDVEPSKVDMGLELGSVPEWDSLGHLTILTSLDAETGEKASEIPELGAMTSLDAIWKALVNAGLAS